MIEISFRNMAESPMYSLSVELKEISDCNRDAHDMGNPLYIITYPCRDREVSLSHSEIVESQFPEKSASTYAVNSSFVTFDIIPLSGLRYLAIHFTSFPCSSFGSSQNREHH